MDPPAPATPTQPGVLDFRVWRRTYAYLIDCIQHCVQVGMAARSVKLDEPRLRANLERHLYATSANRFRSFVLLK